jgi:SsrA-binding protein
LAFDLMPTPTAQVRGLTASWVAGRLTHRAAGGCGGPSTRPPSKPPLAATGLGGCRRLARRFGRPGPAARDPRLLPPGVVDLWVQIVAKKGAKKGSLAAGDKVTVLAQNRKARHIFSIVESVEAGIMLAGSEVKSIRAGRATLVDAFAEISNGEAWLLQMDISTYVFAHSRNHEPRRRRKLLLHRAEIDRLAGKVREKGYTMVPLSIYEKAGHMKVELALVTGKQEFDRREDTKKREAQREIDRAMSARRR